MLPEHVRQSVMNVLARKHLDINLTADTPLQSSGLLSSMDVLEVLLSLEALGYDVTSIDVSRIDTIGDICRALASETVAAERR